MVATLLPSPAGPLNPFKEPTPPLFSSSLSPRTRPTRLLIVCARKPKRGSGSLLRLWNNYLPRLLSLVASNTNTLLPETLDAVIQGGVGGGGVWKCVRGWRGFKGRKPKLGSFWVWLGFGMCGCCLLYFGREVSNGVVLGALGFSGLVAGVLGSSGTRRVVKDLVLGVIIFGALLGLGFRKRDVQNWVGRIRECAPVLEIVKGKKRKW